MLDPKIQDTIEYHTRQISRTCKLDVQSTEDVRQELTLTALIAIQNHTGDMSANLLTYVKAALRRGAAGVVRKIKNALPTANADNVLSLTEIQDDYRRQTDPNEACKPLTVSMGPQLEQLVETNSLQNLELKLDIEALWQKLTPEQRELLNLLDNGYTQEQIARRMGLTQRGVCFRIQKLRQIFRNLENSIS